MSRASTEDPLKVFRYRIEIDGFARAGFSEMTGLDRTTEQATYREGGDNETVQKSAGLTTYPDITLRRGQIVGSQKGGDNDFFEWCQQVHDVAGAGNALNYRKDFDIVQFSAQNVEVRRWRISEAWPTGFKPMGDLKADANDNSMEELRITHEGWSLVA